MSIGPEPLYSLKKVTFQYASKTNSSSNFINRKNNLNKENLDGSDAFELGPLNMNLSKGKITSILGRSGCGKTTLLSILGMLRSPCEGEIVVNLDKKYSASGLWNDESILESFRANNIGFALQRGELLPYLTLFENAELILRFLRKSQTEINSSLGEIFSRLYASERNVGKYSDVIHSKPLGVSQGQYQRASIARSLANQPSIILADEPTGNLDQHTGRMAMQIFREIVDENQRDGKERSIIIVTHDLLLAIEFADEILILCDGKVKSHYVSEARGRQKVWYSKRGRRKKYANSALRDRLIKEL